MKTMSYQYRNSHYKDKTVWRPSHLYNGNPHTLKDLLKHGPGANEDWWRQWSRVHLYVVLFLFSLVTNFHHDDNSNHTRVHSLGYRVGFHQKIPMVIIKNRPRIWPNCSGIHSNVLSPLWRHQMESFSALLALCSPVPVNSPHKGQWRGALMFSLICVWINHWVNNREAGDLRRPRGRYDVTVMRIGTVSSSILDQLYAHILFTQLCTQLNSGYWIIWI